MAWCYLHRRLRGGWSEYFKKHQKTIETINKKLHGHRVFLKAKFTTLKSDIDREISAGAEYRNCAACGCHSARVGEVHEVVRQVECHVCGTRRTFLRLECPRCHELSDIDDMASASCDNDSCGAGITLADVMGEYIPPHDPRDEERQSYYCASCQHPEDSATILSGGYFCFWCMQWFDVVEQCEYCGQHLVGFDPQGSGFYGCFMCEDAAREHFDRD